MENFEEKSNMIWHADEKNLEEKLMMQKSGGSLERCPWIDERR